MFGAPIRRDILARMVNWQRAKRRAGTHKTKSVGEISGTGAKPFAQKGTGRARAGSLRSVQHRGGAVSFGPVVRDHSHKLQKKVRKMALRCALSSKLADGKLIVLDETKLPGFKTSELIARLNKFGAKSLLIIDGPEVNGDFARAAANIPNEDVLPQQGANVYDILRRDTLVLTKDAVNALVERLK